MHLVAKSPEDLLSSFVDGPDDEINEENINNKHKKLVGPDEEHVVTNNNKENINNKQEYTEEENEAYDTIINNIKDPNELSQILQEISLNNTISSRQGSNRVDKQKQSINNKKKKNTSKPKQQKHDNSKVEDTTLSNENYFMKQIRLAYEAAGAKIEFDNIDLEIVIAIVDHFSSSTQSTNTKDNTAIYEDENGIDTDEESLDAIEFNCNALSLAGSGSGGGSIVYALNNVMLSVTKAIFPSSSTWGEDC